MSNIVGSINDSRINVKKCASRNGLKLRSVNTARSMRCKTAVQDRGRRLNQSQFRSMAEVSFLPSANTRKRASASRERARVDNFTICYRDKQIGVSVSCVCPVIDIRFHRNIAEVVCGTTATLYNVITNS